MSDALTDDLADLNSAVVTKFLDMMVIKDLVRSCRGMDEVGVRLAIARHEALREGARLPRWRCFNEARAPMLGHGVSIIAATEDPVLFARWFRKRETWASWFAFLKVLFGLPMSDAELATFRSCTGRQTPPTGITREAHLICGRRAGKSFVLALTAVYLSSFVDWRGCFSPGERGTIMVIAADRKQARTIFRYILALLKVRLLGAGRAQRRGIHRPQQQRHHRDTDREFPDDARLYDGRRPVR